MTKDISREFDIVPASGRHLSVTVDGKSVKAIPGETILSLLFAIGQQAISKNDHGIVTGAYCGMGICFCCLVTVNGKNKVKACQTLVEEGMSIQTQLNRIELELLK